MASIGDTIGSLVEWLPTATAEALAGILVAWDTARQVVRTVAGEIADASTQSIRNATLAKYQDVPLSPAVLADMSIRQLSIPADATGIDPTLVAEAALSGVSPSRFSALASDTGESYGIIDALRLWHQGSYLVAPVPNPDTTPGAAAYVSGASLGGTYGITEQELDKVIYYSRVRDQFITDLKALSWGTMSGADAINAAVKGRADLGLAQTLFEAAGGMPEQFELLYESAGDSVGVEHAASLYDHGYITEDQFHEVVLQSRINPRFYDIAALANVKFLSAYQIHQAQVAGLIDATTATTWLEQDGYPTDQATAFASAGATTKAATAKAETEAMILSEYEAQIISETEATTALEALGYTAASIPFVLDSIVARRVLSMRNAVITRIRTAYVTFLITEDAARTDLTNLGLPTAAIDQFLTYWTVEQQTNIHRLSSAQVGKLLEEGEIDANNAVARWQQMGYPPEEANLLTLIYPYGSKATAGTVPVVTTIPPSNTATPPGPTDTVPS